MAGYGRDGGGLSNRDRYWSEKSVTDGWSFFGFPGQEDAVWNSCIEIMMRWREASRFAIAVAVSAHETCRKFRGEGKRCRNMKVSARLDTFRGLKGGFPVLSSRPGWNQDCRDRQGSQVLQQTLSVSPCCCGWRTRLGVRCPLTLGLVGVLAASICSPWAR